MKKITFAFAFSLLISTALLSSQTTNLPDGFIGTTEANWEITNYYEIRLMDEMGTVQVGVIKNIGKPSYNATVGGVVFPIEPTGLYSQAFPAGKYRLSARALNNFGASAWVNGNPQDVSPAPMPPNAVRFIPR